MMTAKKVSRQAKAKDIIDYLSEELNLDLEAGLDPGLAQYHRKEAEGMAAYLGGQGPVRVGAGVSDAVAHYLGIGKDSAPDTKALENVITGKTANGRHEWLNKEATVAGFDYTFSADRSVSVAFALAQTAHERAAILGAHRQAVADTMREIAVEMGYTRRGKDGVETVEGELAWFEFDHTASRPVPASALYADDPTVKDTILPGDPNLHTHSFIPNFVLTYDADGKAHVGTVDSERLRGRVHEFGALYQTRLAAHLQRLGIETEWDGAGAVRVTAIPEEIRDLFSKRAKAGLAAAKAWAAQKGVDYDNLDPIEQHKLMRASLGLDRNKKEGLQARFEEWVAQARAAGYEHKSVVPSDDELAARPKAEPLSDEERLAKAVERADALSASLFAKEAVLTLQQLRVCCAQAAIGLFERFEDVDRIQAALLERGVTMDDERTAIIVGHLPVIDETRPERDLGQGADGEGRLGGKRVRGRNGQSLRGDETLVTTQRHADNEQRVVKLTREAAADRTGALTHAETMAAVKRAETRAKDPLSFKGEHGEAQLRGMRHLGEGGRLALLIGVAGSGKTTLMQPLVDGWTQKGMTVHGIAVAWRQANDLEGAGIAASGGEGEGPQTAKTRRRGSRGADNSEDATREMRDAGVSGDRLHAVAAFIKRYETGKLKIDSNTVVLLDEVGQLGIKDARRLLEIQRRTRCHFKLIGDPLQCVSVEAGPTIDLMIRALGAENVPSIITTIRQQGDQEKVNAGLWRTGQAAVVIENKRRDGTAQLVRGDSEAFAAVAAKRWAELTDEVAEQGLTVGVTAPTNAQARIIGNAIREIRRERGEITGEGRVIACTDSRGADAFELSLAVGDRVRLFRKIRGKRMDGRGGGMQLGVNGTIVEVRGITDEGLILRGANNVDCLVKWKTLTHKETGRVQLNRGEVFTPDGSQGITRHLMLDTMGGGSDAMTAGKAYVTGSRHRLRHELMISEDAEREAILRERPLGDTTPVSEDQVWERVAANLSRTGAKTSAMILAEKAQDLRRAAGDLLLRHQIDRASRLSRGQNPDQAFSTRRQEEHAVRTVLPSVEAAVERAERAATATREVIRDLGASLTAGSRGEVQVAARNLVQTITGAISEAAPKIRAVVAAMRERLGLTKPEPTLDEQPEIQGPTYR